MRVCTKVMQILKNKVLITIGYDFFTMELKDWLILNLNSHGREKEDWSMLGNLSAIVSRSGVTKRFTMRIDENIRDCRTQEFICSKN